MLCKISVMKVHVHCEIEEPFLAPIVRRELMRSFGQRTFRSEDQNEEDKKDVEVRARTSRKGEECMKFGASIWPFQWDPPYEDGISRIASLGFEAVELIGWNRQILHEYYTPKKVKELRTFVEDSGLEISEFVSTPEGMASSDEKERDRAVEHFKRAVEVAVGLGTGIVNSVSAYPFDLEFPRITDRPHLQQWTVDIPSGLDWKKNWEDYVDVMRRCALICEDADLRYALEPHPYRHMSNTASMLRLIERVGSDALGMNFDPSHLFPVGETPHVVIYQLAERIFHCHFSDNDGTTNVHWRPGRGKIDWGRFWWPSGIRAMMG
jgi:sugar phosphate isomerase/epimerase